MGQEVRLEAPVASAWRWPGHSLWPARRQLLRDDGTSVEIEDRVFDLLVLLLQHRERALERPEVIAAIWGKRPVSDATLRQLVYKARHAIGDDGEHQTMIRTLYGRSLQWVAPVELVLEHGLPVHAGGQSALAGHPARPQPTPAADTGAPGVATESAAAGGPAVAPQKRRSRLVRYAKQPVPGWITALAILAAVLSMAVASIHGLRPASSAPTLASTPAAGVSTIAVLPFLERDAQADDRHFSDGLAEELINRLARMPNLRVTSRTSSFALRGSREDLREMARKLGVAHVVEGSVDGSRGHVRVRVALVDARQGYELWSGEYDAAADDVVGVEDRIAGDIVAALYPKLRIAPAPRERIAVAARAAYLVGLQYLARRTAPDLASSIDYFQRAVKVQPDYAEAWGALATAYAVWTDYDGQHAPDLHYQDARAAAERAAALDPAFGRAHAVLGMLATRHWRWQEADAQFRQALRLDPSDATAHQWYAMYLWYMQRMDEALAQMRMAHQLDPLSPAIDIDLGRALLYAGQLEPALAQYRQAVALAPKFPLAHIFMAEGDMAQGREADALEEVHTAIALAPQPTPPSYIAMLGVALSRTHHVAGARAQLARLETLSQQQYVSGVSLAFLYAQLGMRDKVFEPLFAAQAAHDPLMLPAISDRRAFWYADPRIAQLRRQMNLPPP